MAIRHTKCTGFCHSFTYSTCYRLFSNLVWTQVPLPSATAGLLSHSNICLWTAVLLHLWVLIAALYHCIGNNSGGEGASSNVVIVSVCCRCAARDAENVSANFCEDKRQLEMCYTMIFKFEGLCKPYWIAFMYLLTVLVSTFRTIHKNTVSCMIHNKLTLFCN